MRARRWGAYLAGFLLLAVAVALTFFAVRVNLGGGVFVRDPLGLTRAVAIEYDARTVSLWRMPGGRYFGWPEGSGELVLRCANGRKVDRAIVLRGMSLRVTVLPQDCAG